MLEGPNKWLTQMIYMKHDRISTGRRWSVGLFTPMAEELNSERPRTNPVSDQGGTWIGVSGMRVQRSYRSTKLPASRGGGGREKREGVEGEKKRVPFSPSVFPLPSPSPFAHAAQAITAYICLILSPNEFFVTFIQDWVYKQICCCTTPLHPLVAPLLEAFVHSVINPVSSKSSKQKETAFTLHGFTDAEVMSVFAPDQQVCVIFSVMTGLENLLE